MSETHIPPVVILGPHRAGTSAIAGSLAAWGLDLGTSIPAGRDNPAGFFEDASILAAHKRLLRNMGRDWTDPPLSLDPSAIDATELEAAVAERDRSHPWGFKDPRALFLLPAWGTIVDDLQLIGVFRPASSIAASLEQRNDFGPEVALEIAHTYLGQLARLRRHVSFPIIRFDQERNVLIKQLADVAEQIGLVPDMSIVEGFLGSFDSDHLDQPTADEQFLAAVGAEPPSVSTVRSAAIGSLPAAEITAAPTYHGPGHHDRGRTAWLRSRAVVPEVGNVVYSARDGQRTRLPGAPALEVTSEKITHLVAPDVLDVTAPKAVHTFLAEHAGNAGPRGVVAVTGYVIDEPDSGDTRFFRSDGRLARSEAPPYLHYLDAIQGATVGTGWSIANVEALEGHGDRSLVLFVNHTPNRPTTFRTRLDLGEALDAAEIRHTNLDAQIAGLRTELADLRKSLRASERNLDHARKSRDNAQKRLTDASENLNARIGTLASKNKDLTALIAQERRTSAERTQKLQQRNVSTAAELRRVRDVAERYQRQYAETSSSLQKHRNQIASQQNKVAAGVKKYERLRNRRSVRATLFLANLGKPVFAVVRRIRTRIRPGS